MTSLKDYRDAAISRLDNLAWFGSKVGELKRLNDTEYQFRCPIHQEEHGSANVNIRTGAWYCHVCNVGGSAIDLLMRTGSSYKDALAEVGNAAGLGDPPGPGRRAEAPGRAPSQTARPSARLSDQKVEEWHAAALRNPDLMRWFRDKRGFTPDTVARWKLGWDGERVTIPVRDEGGALVNVRRYLRDAKGEQGKMLSLAQGTGNARLFPADVLALDEVILVEGEWDCILMHQQGFRNTLTVTSGAGIFNPEWVALFEQKRVVIAYDNDDAGRRGSQKVARMLAPVAEVGICVIPGLPEKGDVTDFFVEQSRDAEELRQLILDAEPFLLSAAPVDDGPPVRVSLPLASDAVAYRGKRLEIPVMVSGKAMSPYTVPSRFTVRCDLGNKRYCPVCPLAEVSGQREVVINPADAKVLQLLAVSDQQQNTAMRALAKAVPQCNRPQIEVTESTNVEELRLIPEIDTTVAAGDAEYASRVGYLIGHGLRTNRSYTVLGYTHPDPRTQLTVHLLSEAIPAQDSISAFAMTSDLRESLKTFQAGDDGVEGRFRSIYDDMRLNVHRIQGRFDMQVAYDLVWHSAIAFYFNGAYVRRGWAECMVVGDSGQGKTEMAMGLLSHYRMGERVQGEQASLAGLIGGLEKMGDTWILGWGKVPQNDKRLLVVDETQGLQSGQVEAMSDVRATGVAEVTKIRTERTNARCRLIWLANPSTGRPLAQYNQGVLALKDVFHKPEDIRRLDLAIAVATGDVDLREINALHAQPVAPTYSADACRQLILWAWSRTPDQIRFSPSATQAILDHAMDFGRRYHASIPIVEPADQRLKLARLSVAAAARLFSTDETGEHVCVEVDHVEFIAAYLHRIYNSRGMAYGEYSGQMKSGESLSPDERLRIRTELLALPNHTSALDFFRQAKVFRKTELEEQLGWSSEECKATLKLLTTSRLIRSTRDGYVKQPVFIELLREIAGGPAAPTPVEMEDLPWNE
jgi:hypothetical protein